MALEIDVDVRNARLDAIQTVVGTSPKLEIRTGPQPEDCTSASTGTLLATLDLPAVWMSPAVNGVKELAGTWQTLAATGTGTAAHFRLFSSDGTKCYLQGSVGQGIGDIQLDNTSIATGQKVTVESFTLTEGNA